MIDLVGEYCASLRRMPLSAAQELHSTFGIPWRVDYRDVSSADAGSVRGQSAITVRA